MLNKKVAIEVEIKNIKRVSKLKKELQELRAEMKATEKLTAEGANLGKKRAKQYSETATKVKHKSAEVRKLNNYFEAEQQYFLHTFPLLMQTYYY